MDVQKLLRECRAEGEALQAAWQERNGDAHMDPRPGLGDYGAAPKLTPRQQSMALASAGGGRASSAAASARVAPTPQGAGSTPRGASAAAGASAAGGAGAALGASGTSALKAGGGAASAKTPAVGGGAQLHRSAAAAAGAASASGAAAFDALSRAAPSSQLKTGDSSSKALVRVGGSSAVKPRAAQSAGKPSVSFLAALAAGASAAGQELVSNEVVSASAAVEELVSKEVVSGACPPNEGIALRRLLTDVVDPWGPFYTLQARHCDEQRAALEVRMRLCWGCTGDSVSPRVLSGRGVVGGYLPASRVAPVDIPVCDSYPPLPPPPTTLGPRRRGCFSAGERLCRVRAVDCASLRVHAARSVSVAHRCATAAARSHAPPTPSSLTSTHPPPFLPSLRALLMCSSHRLLLIGTAGTYGRAWNVYISSATTSLTLTTFRVLVRASSFFSWAASAVWAGYVYAQAFGPFT